MWPGDHRELMSFYLATEVCVNQLLPQHAEKPTKIYIFPTVELVHHNESRGRTKKNSVLWLWCVCWFNCEMCS